MFHCNLLGLHDHPPAPSASPVTESGKTCADLRSASLFGRMAEQSPITGYEPKDLVEISIEYTPTNFPTWKNSFTTDIDDVPSAVASDITETIEAGQLTSPLFHAGARSKCKHRRCLCLSASSSQQQPASSSVIKRKLREAATW